MTLKINNPIDAENVKMADGSNAETAINAKQDSLSKGSYVGSLDDLFVPGWHWCDFSKVTEAPYTNGYGYVIVEAKPNAGGARSCVQKIYRFGNAITEIAIRPYTNSQWCAWRKISTVAI